MPRRPRDATSTTDTSLDFGTKWGDCQSYHLLRPAGRPTNGTKWAAVPLWTRLLDPMLRQEVQQVLQQSFGQRDRRTLPAVLGDQHGSSVARRESHKRMKRLIDHIVECGMVTVSDRAGRFHAVVLSREGQHSLPQRTLKMSPDIQHCITKWWENIVEPDPSEDKKKNNTRMGTPQLGITQEGYVWVVSRILSFLLFHPGSNSPQPPSSDPYIELPNEEALARLRVAAEIDWHVDSGRRRRVFYPAFCDLLFDLTMLWCDIDSPISHPTATVMRERCRFLNTLYDDVFFDRVPKKTPTYIAERIRQRIMARAAPIDQVVLFEPGQAPPLKASSPKSSTRADVKPAPLRRYELVLRSIQYLEPTSFNEHNLYPSFPYRKIHYPEGEGGEPTSPTAPTPGIQQIPDSKAAGVRVPHKDYASILRAPLPKKRLLPSYSHTLAAIKPEVVKVEPEPVPLEVDLNVSIEEAIEQIIARDM